MAVEKGNRNTRSSRSVGQRQRRRRAASLTNGGRHRRYRGPCFPSYRYRNILKKRQRASLKMNLPNRSSAALIRKSTSPKSVKPQRPALITSTCIRSEKIRKASLNFTRKKYCRNLAFGIGVRRERKS